MGARSTDPDSSEESEFRVEPVAAGEHYFPWSYGRRASSGRVSRQVHGGGRGCHVFNALDAHGRVVGSADFQVGPRAEDSMIATEEFAYGGGNNSRGPYLWPDDGQETYIIVLRGLWTRPKVRRQGIARLLVASVGEFGLPMYVAFGNPHMEHWFETALRPSNDWEMGYWQEAVQTFQAYAHDPWPSTRTGGRYRWNLTCAVKRRIVDREFYAYDPPLLGDVLFSPKRATWMDLDGGAGEVDLTDTAFAEDRRFGYELTVDRHADASLDIDGDPEDEAALDQIVTLRATGVLTVTDLAVLRDYAQFRRMLRTGVARPPRPATEFDAVVELLVAAQQEPFEDTVEFSVEVMPLPAD